MLTRRTFFASLAALAVAPRVATAAPRLAVFPSVLPLLRELLLDGEATDSDRARRLFQAAIGEAASTTRVELVNPRQRVVDWEPADDRRRVECDRDP